MPEDLDMGILGALDRGVASDKLRQIFASNGITLSTDVSVMRIGDTWQLVNAITPTAQTYSLEVHMKTPTYHSFSPVSITFGYRLKTYAEPDHTLLFTATDVIPTQTNTDVNLLSNLDRGVVSDALRQVFGETLSTTLSMTATVQPVAKGNQWRLEDQGDTYIMMLEIPFSPVYHTFSPADISFSYKLNVYTDKHYRVTWGDGTSNDYTIADDYEIVSRTLSLGDVTLMTTRTLQLNARHVYQQMGVYTVTFSVVPETGSAWVYHSYPVVVNYGKAYPIYLPLVMRNSVSAPDLWVRALQATTNTIQIVVENQGNAPVSEGFWVQAYIDPDPVPDAVNQIWYLGYADYGVSWAVDATLMPSEALTLTLARAEPTPYTALPEALAMGTPVYVQVDAYHPETDYGAVLELDEIGETYNNITATVVVSGTVAPSVSPKGWEAIMPLPYDLPLVGDN
jgi:hypothetical protein